MKENLEQQQQEYTFFLIDNPHDLGFPENLKRHRSVITIKGVRYFSVRRAAEEIKSESLTHIQRRVKRGEFYTVNINDEIFIPEYAIKIWQAEKNGGFIDAYTVETDGFNGKCIAWNNEETLKFLPKNNNQKTTIAKCQISADELFMRFSTNKNIELYFYIKNNTMLHIKNDKRSINAYIIVWQQQNENSQVILFEAYLYKNVIKKLKETFKKDLEKSLKFLESSLASYLNGSDSEPKN